MSDSQPNRSLSDIGHLFLSSVREKHTNGAPRPVRRPPGSPPIESTGPVEPVVESTPISLELTPEELAGVQGADSHEDGPRIPPVTAVIGAHLNGSQAQRVREYARHLAHDGQRIGLIEVDSATFKLSIFDRLSHAPGEQEQPVQPADHFDARAMQDAIEELSWDLDRWLLLLPNPRSVEARSLLRHCTHWVLLSTCDHDGVVSGYRMLKGLQENSKPRLSLAMLNSRDEMEADKIYRKLAGVCDQFLAWPLETELPVCTSEDVAQHVAEHVVMHCQPNRSRAELPNPPQWRITGEFLQRAMEHARESREAAEEFELQTADFNQGEARVESTPMMSPQPPAASPFVDEPSTFTASPEDRSDDSSPRRITPMKTYNGHAEHVPQSVAGVSVDGPRASDITEVLDLPDSAITAASILSAVLRNPAGGLMECPLSPPMCPDARLAVTRDRSLVLLAVSHQGLAEMRSIARGYRWLVENVALIRMAIPQMSVDTAHTPRLRLLVDHADLSAEILQPMLASATVTVQGYRRLRWGGKTGLLLEAA